VEEGVEMVALECLGKGFDLASDFRLRFAKEGKCSKRLVVLDEQNKRDILIPGTSGVTIRGVSENIRCDKGDRIRFKSDVLEFNQVPLFHLKPVPHLIPFFFWCIVIYLSLSLSLCLYFLADV